MTEWSGLWLAPPCVEVQLVNGFIGSPSKIWLCCKCGVRGALYYNGAPWWDFLMAPTNACMRRWSGNSIISAKVSQYEPQVYSLTYRDLKEIMAERNLSVDHITIWRGSVATALETPGTVASR